MTHKEDDTAATLRAISEDLATKYRGIIDEDRVQAIVQQSYEHLAKDATVTNYLPVLTSRAASESLDVLTQADGLAPP